MCEDGGMTNFAGNGRGRREGILQSAVLQKESVCADVLPII